ncbi:MAG TPA: sugar phosphate isomerase/epimerase family protein [Saprospiraceae bacterium]|nr:sugar phosphate isomerase/epimerase family protein [Saprospiraceae bacterium]
MSDIKRRTFIKTGTLGTMALTLFPGLSGYVSSLEPTSGPRFRISLAQWSLHRSLQNKSIDHLDFARVAAVDFGIYGIEYVNTFFKDKASDSPYLAEMNARAGDAGVEQLLIMIDGEGGLAELDDTTRKTAVTNHYKWVEAAKTLGCHSIRVNAYGVSDDGAALHTAAVDGLGMLASFAEKVGINVIVENHGGLSSDGKWLAGVIREVNMPGCGTLPDFGNFCLRHADDGMGHSNCAEEYDRYLGVEELMPFAKAVSAKSYDFDAAGNESTIDFQRMIAIVKKSGYKGYLGIEYEGSRLSEHEGIRATKKLLERLIQ